MLVDGMSDKGAAAIGRLVTGSVHDWPVGQWYSDRPATAGHHILRLASVAS